MEATITFKRGKKITVEVNGSCFIKKTKPAFPDDLSVVTIENGQETQVFENARLVECASVDGKYWFTFVSETESERVIRELRENKKMLDDSIHHLS